MAIEPGNAD